MEYNETTALIVVDVQNDFADPGGSLYVEEGEEAIPLINAEIEEAANAGATVVYTQDWHPEVTPHFQKYGGIWPVHCVAGTKGAEFHPDLNVIEDALIIKKGVGGEDGYSAFNLRDPETGETTPTGLAARLEDIENVVVVGLALDYCVKDTAIDATSHFNTTVLAGGCRPVDLEPGDAARAVAEMVSAGVDVA
ncbi:MAG TPA: isochorismatase family protein [Acidimicrobiia bacterium]